MSGVYKQRIAKVKRLLREDKYRAALLISSAPYPHRSRDTAFLYRPDSDLFYLTGSTADNLCLFVTHSSIPVLIAPKPDRTRETWLGKHPDHKKTAGQTGAKLILTDNPEKELKLLLKGIETLYHQNQNGYFSFKIARSLFETPSHLRSSLPRTLAHSDIICERLRLYKEPREVKFIEQAYRITNSSLFQVLPFIKPGRTEKEIAASLDSLFELNGGDGNAFNTIAASGPSAAVLHYEKRSRTLKRGELLLLDCGAQYQMYASDITRIVPVSGAFGAFQRDIYEIVLTAQKKAISKVKPGTDLKTLHTAAARVITEGLKELGILRGKTSALMEKEAYKPYFMHGIGHSLGIDVHDVGKLRADHSARLEKGMVVTVEPGLYFPKKTKHVPRCGIRIEDGVLVTKSSARVLSRGFPKEINEIEELL